MQYYIFKEFDNELLSIARTLNPNNKEEGIQRMNFFLTTVYRKQLTREHIYGFMEVEENRKKPYFYSEDLKNLLTKNYYRYIAELEKTGLLLVLKYKYCSHGKFFKLYSLPDKVKKCHKTRAKLSFKRIIKGVETYYKFKNKKLKGIDKKVFENQWRISIQITKEQLAQELSIRYNRYYNDKVEYIKYLATKQEKELGIKIMTIDEYMEQLNFYHEYINTWNSLTRVEKMSFFTVDSFGKRFHSPFTILPSFIRKYIVAEGLTDLVCLDLRQSQPTILAKLVYDQLGPNDYTQAVNSEYIYDRFPYSPQIAKKKFLIGIFSKGSNIHNKELSQLFPSLAHYKKIIRKMTLYRNKQKLQKYKNISCLLQREESKIFRMIWKKLLNEKIRFINVHDAVYVDKNDLERTHEIMTEVFKKMMTGIDARIKVEPIGKPIE